MIISKIGAYSDMDLSLVKINVIYSRKYVDQLVHEQRSRSENGVVLVLGGKATYKDLIRSGLYSIGEVAEKVGYDDIYYFSRMFKKATGQSPTGYYKSSH